MSLDIERIDNPFLRCHLEYVEHTESPRLFHIWSAITALGACMGRHVYLDSGIGSIYGNQYVLLVGQPGTRKSSAIKFATRVMQNATDVRFAPDDTGGQRQGLISALIENDTEDDDTNIETSIAMNVETLMNSDINLSPIEDRHVMFVNASEFGSFIGQTSLDLMRFLIKMWDGEDYKYQLRQYKSTLYDPLLTMLGGTTPTDISMLLPPEAIGQGFMSRIILVFAPNKEKSVPPSKAKLNDSLEPELQKVYRRVEQNMRGAMNLTPDAERLLDAIYAQEFKLEDTRFIYYSERRDQHLRKLSMILAVSRNSMTVDLRDIELANYILSLTEVAMPEALGEFGLSPIAQARHKMLEYLRFVNEPVGERVLWAFMQRDMKLMDFQNALNGLVNTGKVAAVDGDRGRQFIYIDNIAKGMAALDDNFIDTLILDSYEHND